MSEINKNNNLLKKIIIKKKLRNSLENIEKILEVFFFK
jgi:hypothetical protein